MTDDVQDPRVALALWCGRELAFADPEPAPSFAFVKNPMHHGWSTAFDLAAAVYDCL